MHVKSNIKCAYYKLHFELKEMKYELVVARWPDKLIKLEEYDN